MNLLFRGFALATTLALLIAVPWVAPATVVQFGISTLMLATLAQGWSIIGGYTGYASFGGSVFYGLGSYGTAIAMIHYHLPFGIALIVGGLVAAIFAVLVGLPVLRLRGHYFAIATLALAQVVPAIVSNLDIAGRNIGLILPLVKNDALFYEAALGLLLATTVSIWYISRSRFGFGLMAIRENEDAAAAMGINTTRYKIQAFAIAAFFSALAGGIHAYWITFIDPGGEFDISLNVKMIIMAVFGGPGSVLGPIAGAFLLSGISEILSSKISSVASLFFGVVIVVAVVLMPHGIADLWRRYRKLGLRYFSENIRENRV
ncbi:MAG TPA: branched-chain amino acid ABC transporter permease [Burkholderiales bacterium]|nr:branched-chain amino acid ABC transporter permease [Burkholderiales bacterium]